MTNRRNRPPMRRGNLALLVFLIAMSWAAVIGIAEVLRTIEHWVSQ